MEKQRWELRNRSLQKRDRTVERRLGGYQLTMRLVRRDLGCSGCHLYIQCVLSDIGE